MEIKVECTNYESPPGRQQPRREEVEVIHQPHSDENPGVGGAWADAATKVAEKIDSAIKSVSGTGTGDDDDLKDAKMDYK